MTTSSLILKALVWRAMAAVLAASPEKLEQMGEMGSLRVRQQHDASIEATKMVVLFRQAIAKQPNTVATVKEFGNVQMPAASGPASN